MIAALGLSLGGCSCGAHDEAPDAWRAPAVEEAPPDPREAVVSDWLDAQAISDVRVGRSVLFTWLTDDELAALREGRPITEVAPAAPGAIDLAVAEDDAPVAIALRDAARSGRRLAWPTAWGARVLAPDTARHLARIELRPESVIAAYDTRARPSVVHFTTELDRVAPTADTLAVPEVWAAVMHTHRAEGHALARAYVVVSAVMLGRVSVGTPETASQLQIERERLVALAHALPTDAPTLSRDELLRAWSAHPGEEASLRERFAAACPGDFEPLVPSGNALRALAARLVDADHEPYEWRTSIRSEPRGPTPPLDEPPPVERPSSAGE